MHTISMLRRTLGLSSDNQVRNRIERIKGLLAEHIRRGPNNQIFLTEPGLEIMRQFQELCDTGLTLAEASQVMRLNSQYTDHVSSPVSSRLSSDQRKPDEANSAMAAPLIANVMEELAQIRMHLAALQQQALLPHEDGSLSAEPRPWWTYLREDVDVT